MPNHVKNIITFECENQKKKLSAITSVINDLGYFDFDKIIPMPKELRETSSPNDKNPEEMIAKYGHPCWYSWSIANRDTKWSAYDQHLPYESLGCRRWHRTYQGGFFRGNKERVYPYRINKKRFKKFVELNGHPERFEFSTAWSVPEKLYYKLSKRFPEITVNVVFADEDLGCNCGEFTLKNGQIISQKIAPSYRDQSKEEHRKWCEFAFKINHPNESPLDWGMDENYNYIEG